MSDLMATADFSGTHILISKKKYKVAMDYSKRQGKIKQANYSIC